MCVSAIYSIFWQRTVFYSKSTIQSTRIHCIRPTIMVIFIMTILQWIKPWLLRLASAATVHWWTKLGRNSRYFFDPIIDTQTQPVLLYIACWSQSLFLSSSYCKLSSLKSQSYSIIYTYLELNLFVFCIQFCSVKMLTISSYVIVFFNPLNPKIKSRILICCPYSFPTEVVGRRW